MLDNTVGADIQAFANSGGVVLADNVVDGNLQCKDNDPAPVGGNNQVSGNMEDQCANLQPPSGGGSGGGSGGDDGGSGNDGAAAGSGGGSVSLLTLAGLLSLLLVNRRLAHVVRRPGSKTGGEVVTARDGAQRISTSCHWA